MMAVHVSVPVECRPGLQEPKQQPLHQPGSFNTRTDTRAGTGRFNSELHGSMKRGVRKHVLGMSDFSQTVGYKLLILEY